MDWLDTVVQMVIGICTFASICFIFYHHTKCKHHWKEVETLRGTYSGWTYVIKVMQCTKCGEIKKIKLV